MTRPARTVRTRQAALDLRAQVVAALKLPAHYSRDDLKPQGGKPPLLREVGGGRHVPPEQIVRTPVPEVRVSPTGKTWAVDAVEGDDACCRACLKRREVAEPRESAGEA